MGLSVFGGVVGLPVFGGEGVGFAVGLAGLATGLATRLTGFFDGFVGVDNRRDAEDWDASSRLTNSIRNVAIPKQRFILAQDSEDEVDNQ